MIIVQWNARSIKRKNKELNLLIKDLQADIVLINETFLKPDDNFEVKGFTVFSD